MLKDPSPFKDNRFLQLLVAWMLLVWVLSAIKPFSRPEWVIENFLVVGYAMVLTLTWPQVEHGHILSTLPTLSFKTLKEFLCHFDILQ